MKKLSVCMIVKNEEEVLKRALDCAVRIADEIIITDTGSTDGTKEIAALYTDKVFDFEWTDDFSAARNFSFSAAEGEYLMWLDADDIILEEDILLINELKKELNGDIGTVMMKYNTGSDEKGKPTFSYFRERILKNCGAAVWNGVVHEAISPFGQVIYRDAAITHSKLSRSDPSRNLRIYERAEREGKAFSPRDMYYYARELYYAARYDGAIRLFDDFLTQRRGWVENNIDACRLLSYCYDLSGQHGKVLPALFRSFEFDVPRAETACDIAKFFLDRNELKAAEYWYKTALCCEKNPESGAFISEDCYGFIPYIQLCVCYSRLGNDEKAIYYNEKAGQLRPRSQAYIQNKKYFEEAKK
ncbi:MAG: glycosyltransferase family 2 protein [Oscillospiraceae bacterium]|jgi:glycosyltransferase involved in cell wall biosynthesis|nr:glycosyltransferase family 2 protein [Oscillospiraceae bacterium]